MHNQFKIYCFVAYTQINMFRVLLCPSSGAPFNCLCSHWLPYTCRDWTCFKLRLKHVQSRQSYSNQRLQRQLKGDPDDGHNIARNMLSGVYATKQ
jgi:hypothetical protein